MHALFVACHKLIQYYVVVADNNFGLNILLDMRTVVALASQVAYKTFFLWLLYAHMDNLNVVSLCFRNTYLYHILRHDQRCIY